MSTLHLVNKAWPASNALVSCLAHCGDGDAVLLIEDGVYAAGNDCWREVTGRVNGMPAAVTVSVLDRDLAARGMTSRIAPAFSIVDFDGFVALAAAHQRVVTWF